MIRFGASLLLLAFVLQPPPVAQWDGPGRASITWQQSSFSCLSVQHATGERAFIGCYPKGRIVVKLGGAQTDAAYRPQAGDVYSVTGGGTTFSTPLIGRAYLPLMR